MKALMKVSQEQLNKFMIHLMFYQLLLGNLETALKVTEEYRVKIGVEEPLANSYRKYKRTHKEANEMVKIVDEEDEEATEERGAERVVRTVREEDEKIRNQSSNQPKLTEGNREEDDISITLKMEVK